MGLTVLVGTTKGAFLVQQGNGGGFETTGPYCDGWPINHVVADPESGHYWAAGGGAWHGAGVFRSTDQGKTWDLTRLSSGQMDEWAANDPEFAAMIDWDDTPAPFDDIEQIWSLCVAHGRVYAGAKPAALLVSDDGGACFEKVEGLTNHPSRADWNGGAAGLVLHTIVPHPETSERMWVGISSAGVFATEDGGNSWERRNRLSNAQDCEGHQHPAAPSNGETGHCVHNMQRAVGEGDLLYQQNHHGVWRSNNGGRSWDNITEGLPSTFGFPIAVHPHDPEMIWTLPLNGDSQGRYPPDAKAAVWKSSDGGKTWADRREGLPQEGCYFTVLRQAMATDQSKAGGVYFGTNTGSVFASVNAGDSWQEVARHLPTILSVEVN